MRRFIKVTGCVLGTGIALAALSSCTVIETPEKHPYTIAYTPPAASSEKQSAAPVRTRKYTPKEWLSNITLQMSPQEVERFLGPTGFQAAAMSNEQGEPVLVWEYLVGSDLTVYRFYFLNGKLSKWGRPQEWQPENPMKVEIKTSSDVNLKNGAGKS